MYSILNDIANGHDTARNGRRHIRLIAVVVDDIEAVADTDFSRAKMPVFVILYQLSLVATVEEIELHRAVVGVITRTANFLARGCGGKNA